MAESDEAIRRDSCGRGARRSSSQGAWLPGLVAQSSAQAEIELALYQSGEAVELRLADGKALAQQKPGALQNLLAHRGNAAGHRGAVDVEESTDLLDVEAIDEVEPQQVALLGGEGGDRIVEGALELLPVALLDVAELGVQRATAGAKTSRRAAAKDSVVRGPATEVPIPTARTRLAQ